jgi:hypothetical protein
LPSGIYVITVLEQPVWNIGDFVEAYSFELPRPLSNLLVRIEAFYRWRQLRDFVREEGRLCFTRGSRWATWLMPDERFQQQQVEIIVTEEIHPVVTCCYTVFDWGPNIHIPPRKLEEEVQDLESFLLANAHRT